MDIDPDTLGRGADPDDDELADDEAWDPIQGRRVKLRSMHVDPESLYIGSRAQVPQWVTDPRSVPGMGYCYKCGEEDPMDELKGVKHVNGNTVNLCRACYRVTNCGCVVADGITPPLVYEGNRCNGCDAEVCSMCSTCYGYIDNWRIGGSRRMYLCTTCTVEEKYAVLPCCNHLVEIGKPHAQMFRCVGRRTYTEQCKRTCCFRCVRKHAHTRVQIKGFEQKGNWYRGTFIQYQTGSDNFSLAWVCGDGNCKDQCPGRVVDIPDDHELTAEEKTYEDYVLERHMTKCNMLVRKGMRKPGFVGDDPRVVSEDNTEFTPGAKSVCVECGRTNLDTCVKFYPALKQQEDQPPGLLGLCSECISYRKKMKRNKRDDENPVPPALLRAPDPDSLSSTAESESDNGEFEMDADDV